MTEWLEERAPAKINLTLRVVSLRADGYHLLDSLVFFAGPEASDLLRARPAEDLTLRVEGPFAHQLDPEGDGNLALEAARILRLSARAAGVEGSFGAELVLTKNLPVASGIGGGSADAAAALRLLNRLWNIKAGPAGLAKMGATLGSDIPVCLAAPKPRRMRGTGDRLDPIAPPPPCGLLLVNPGVATPTKEVFAARRALNPGFSAPFAPPIPWPYHPAGFAGVAAEGGNDLQSAALSVAPVIAEVLDALCGQEGCLGAAMSGSGATCFGIFPDRAGAEAAAERLGAAHPDWWRVATEPAR